MRRSWLAVRGHGSAGWLTLRPGPTAVVVGILVLLSANTRTRPLSAEEGPPAPKPPAVVWERSFGTGAPERACCVVETADGGFLVTGSQHHSSGFLSGGGTYPAPYFLRVSQDGVEEWQRSIPEPARYQFGPQAMVVRRNGNLLMVGGLYVGIGAHAGSQLLETDPNGEVVLLHLEYDNNGLFDIANMSDGGFAFAGTTLAADSNFFLARNGADGKKLWGYQWFEFKKDDQLNTVIEAEEGGLMAAGWTKSLGAGGKDVWVAKYDREGKQVHGTYFGGKKDEEMIRIRKLPDGSYVACGYTKAPEGKRSNIYLARLDADVKLVSDKVIQDERDVVPSSIEPTRDGGYLIAGHVGGFWGPDMYLLKLDKDWNKLWECTFGSKLGDDIGKAAIQTRDGGYLLVGWKETEHKSDFHLVKLAPESASTP